MPYVTCPECDTEQLVGRELIGLSADCSKCGHTFRVEEDGASEAVTPRRRKVNNTGPIMVVVALVVLTVGVIGTAVLVGKSRRAEQAKASQPQQKAARQDERPQDQPKAEPRVDDDWPSREITPVRIVLAGIGLIAYCVPTAIAVFRGHANVAPIVVVNLLAGWTFVGWVVALAWAVSYQSREGRDRQRTAE